MSSNNRNRRWACTAVAAALIGLAPVAAADPEPLDKLAGRLREQHVDRFGRQLVGHQRSVPGRQPGYGRHRILGATGSPRIENIVAQFDPSAFSTELTGPAVDEYGYFPVTDVGDLAVLSDYSLYASGLESTLGTGLLDTFERVEATCRRRCCSSSGWLAGETRDHHRPATDHACPVPLPGKYKKKSARANSDAI